MKVDRETAVTKEIDGETHYFCSAGCLHAFEAEREKYMAGNTPADHQATASAHP